MICCQKSRSDADRASDIAPTAESFLVRHRRWILPAAVFAIALGVRIFYFRTTYAISRDSVYYLEQVEEMHQFDDINDFMRERKLTTPPMFLFTIDILRRITSSGEHAMIFTNIIACSLLAALLCRTLLDMDAGVPASALGGLLAALHPKLIEMSLQVQREIPYLFCCGFFLYAVSVLREREKNCWIWLTGAAVAAAGLMRKEWGELLLLIALIEGYDFLVRRKKLAKVLTDLGIITFIVLTVWSLFLLLSGVSAANFYNAMTKPTATTSGR